MKSLDFAVMYLEVRVRENDNIKLKGCFFNLEKIKQRE